ncbi:ATP synthase F0 subcomplex B subunit [Tistlia consotensis]|uniref:ATP synthase subunit b n=1 Tax=Tistlia consotensis USBA 355 TaxID=560819 RepID=A0A1Y6CW57_9PROT|nr:hypothetical protein [Tistlia consotensis]SMF81321.1 ATP synthase F0 subcomplex B subunit [Tistlia consotensis USBA 355]SNS22935.1 ATP synthase F0 subcomplex B subunit [Tistlia consotensis]
MAFDGWTFGFEIVNFLVLAFLLQRFAYRPLLAAIDRRKAATAQEVEAARSARGAAEALRSRLEDEQKALAGRKEAALAEAREAARTEREALLAKARDEAAALLEEGRKRLAGERRAVEGELRQEAGRLAVAIARHLLAEAGSAELRRTLGERAFATLAGLEPAEREALLASLDQGPAVLATAEPLPEAEKAAAEKRLAEILGRPVPLLTAVEPELIEGLELRFPHLALRHSWQHGLEQALAEIARDDVPVQP